MKKNYLIVLFALVCNFAMAQIQQTSYRGAFAPAPATMWTDAWTNFDPNNATYSAVTTVISSDITSNTTWTKDKVYELNGLITVRSNATLTIQAGTVIRSSVASSALVITRGAKLIAIGTAAEPIVFTSKKNAGSRVRGDWGGIVMLGKARYNTNNGVNYIEGLSQNVNTEFGGGLTPTDNDNSGTLKYVRIEFAGYVFSPNNELNGLTMGAVGSGTTIDYVQVSYSNDDSFEWFGGSVNCKHLVAFNGLDDDFDVDSGYKGIVQFGLSIKDPLAADISTSEAFEVDNNAAGSDTNPAPAPTGQGYGDFTSALFTNITCIGANARPNGAGGFVTPNSLHDKALRLRRASQVKIFNSIFLDFKKGLVLESLSSNAAAVADKLKFKNNILVVPTAATFASVNTTSSSVPTTAQVQAWFAASGNTAFATNTGLLTKPYDTTSGTIYTNLDYRPLGDALTGASFTDSSLSGFVVAGAKPGVVSPVTFCKGAVVPALAVTMTETGVSLRWYTKPVTFKLKTAVGGKDSLVTNPDGTQTITVVDGADILEQIVDVFTTTTPVLTSTTVGTKKFYVAEVDAAGAVSERAAIVVDVKASPLVALGTITGMLTSNSTVVTAAVGPYIGTETQITYTVPASIESGVTEYLWTVPLGVNIISTIKNTNSIVVNFKNVASGLFKVGNIGVQAVNGGGCPGAIKTLALTAALPTAPVAIRMTDALLPLPISGIPTAVVSFAKYMGTTTPLTLTATPVAAAQKYVWELPAGVNLDKGTLQSTSAEIYYSAYPFTVPVSKPSAVGNEYYTVVNKVYSNNITISEATKTVNGGTLPNGTVITAQTKVPFTVVNGVTVNPAYPITSSTSNIITVDFAGVTSANTYNYTTTAAVPVSTNVLRIGVKSINGVGVSVTSNATALDPTTTSTAKLLTLKATLPAAPSAIKMTNDAVSTTTAVTVISKFIGTTTPFTLTATPSALASSYSWELPAGVNLVSATSNTNVISVNFAGVATGTTSLYIGVKAVNGIGSSVTTTNGTLTPATTSTARLLKLTATVPAAVTIVTGQIAGLCGNSSYNYTIAPSLLANSYVITAPAGSVVTSANNMTNNSNVLATSDLMFTVMYPAGFVATTTAPKSLLVSAVNGVGTSLLPKTVALSTVLPALGTITSTTGTITSFNQSLTAKVFTVPTNVLFTGYTWTASNGAVITAGQGTNSITVDFSGVVGTLSTTSSIITVVGTNACNSSAVKSTTLRYSASALRLRQETEVNVTEVYPNPVLSDFNIDVTATTAGVLEIAIYSLDGTLAVSPKSIKLQAGLNTITENVSSLKSGIYIVQLVNSSNNEVITKKLVKN